MVDFAGVPGAGLLGMLVLQDELPSVDGFVETLASFRQEVGAALPLDVDDAPAWRATVCRAECRG